jgi:hypothetical protein
MQTITTFDNSAEGWERSLYAFLAEKERRSGSRRTVEGYSRMLQHFFGSVGKPPDRVTSQDVFAWGYGIGLSGKHPSSVTIGARIACLSSFYHFLIRMNAIAANPCDALERPRLQVAPPRGLSADDIRRLLAVIPETPVGQRDRAIILTLTLTGRRRAKAKSVGSDAECCAEQHQCACRERQQRQRQRQDAGTRAGAGAQLGERRQSGGRAALDGVGERVDGGVRAALCAHDDVAGAPEREREEVRVHDDREAPRAVAQDGYLALVVEVAGERGAWRLIGERHRDRHGLAGRPSGLADDLEPRSSRALARRDERIRGLCARCDRADG